MTNDILNHPVIQNCRNKGKPVYVAGDLNIQPSDFENGAIKIFVDAGFEVLKNDTVPYTYPTPIKPEANPGLADIILEYNKNPNHKTIESGIPEFLQTERDLIQAAQGQGIILDLNQYLSTVSDHYPYYVKVKLK
jgi:exonuclease III